MATARWPADLGLQPVRSRASSRRPVAPIGRLRRTHSGRSAPDQITGIVRKVYIESSRSAKRACERRHHHLRNGPQTQGGWNDTRAYAEQLQDWDGWMREGILDLNIPMNYKRDQTSRAISGACIWTG